MDAGILEIYRYVPEVLLEVPVEDMDVDEFAKYLAYARYLEEVESNIYLKALSEFFQEN